MSPTTLLLLITGCLMLQPLSTDLYLPSLPHLATDFAVSPAAVQQTLSMFVIGFGSAQLISGPLSDRYGRRPVLMGGLSIFLLASIACALAPTLDWLVFGRFVQSVGCCTAVVVARAIIRDAYSPSEGARVLAKASSLLAAAPLLGPILGGYLQVAFGWRAAFAAISLIGLIVWIAAMRSLRETNQAPNMNAMKLSGLLHSYREVMTTPAFWAYALPGAISYAAIFSFISGSSFVLIRVLGVSTQTYGLLYAIGVGGYLSGTLIGRRLLGKIGIDHTLARGTALGLAGGIGFLALVLAGVQHWALVVMAQFAVMAAHGINFPCTQSGSVAPFPRQAGAAAGLFGFITMAVALLAGLWVGASHDGTLLPLAVIAATITSVVFVVTRLLARYGHSAQMTKAAKA